MDFNLNDFSGIQNDDSQFMDESNVNINNVWKQNSDSPIQQPIQEEEEKKESQKLISLQDLNFGENVMDMSRISNHEIQEMTQKEADIIQSLQNNQDPFSQFQNYDYQPVELPDEPKLIPAQSAPMVLESKPAETAATSEWKKPVIQKKKRGGGKKPPKAEMKAEALIVQEQNDLNIDDILIDLPLNDFNMVKSPSAPIQQAAFESRTQNNKYARDSPEPQPLFDCLFCVGIHEHLVLQTVKEKNLKYLYSEQAPKLNVEIEDEEDYKEIDRAFAINNLMYDKYKRIKIEPKRESIIDANYEVPGIYASKRQLYNLCQPQVYKSPIQGTINKFVERVAEFQVETQNLNVEQLPVQSKQIAPTASGSTYQVTAAQQYQNQQMSDGGSSMCNEELMVSNMLENFEDIDPEEQSMFMNLNIRNRRQKILHQVSFESEMYDVYAPVFTSDEESITSNSDSSMTSSRGSEMVGTGESQSVSSRGSGDSSSSSVDSQASPDYDSSAQNSNMSQEIDQITPNKGNTLNERDLDYNSENNNSSLSSIHREIQEAPADEASNQVVLQDGQILMPNQGHIIRNMGGKLTLAESGGCQVEEMQDDTVMKQCKSMFRSGAGGQQSNEMIPNESFRDQIFQQRQNHLANQLESLDQKNLLQLELMNLDSSPSKLGTLATDLDSIPSAVRSSKGSTQKRPNVKNQNFEIKLSEAQQQDYIMNSFASGTNDQQKKTTGRFNTKALLNSEQSEKRTTVAQKLQNKLKTGNNSISDSKKFNEDDSIIKILPGFTSSHLKNASQVDESAMNPMSEQFHAQQAHGLTTAFGAESLIQPINYLPEETNQFLMEEIEEVNASGTSQQTPQRALKKGQNEIDFYNHNFRSSKNNKLQIVDSDSEKFEQSFKDEEDKIQSLSPIVKKQDQSNQFMIDNQDSQPSSSKKLRYGNRINLAQIDSKGQTQKINLKTNDSPKKQMNMRTQKMISRKNGQQAIANDTKDQQYGQMGRKQNLQHLRRASNASIGSNKRNGSKQFYYDAAISASMGALPGYEEVQNADINTLATSESQQQLEDADQATGKRSKSKRATGSGIKQPSDLTPVKSRATASKQVEPNSKTSKKQVTKKGSNMEATAPVERVNQKAVTQKIKQLKLNQNNLQKKEANNKGGNYGMLSKEQKKLMLQLQKKADDQQPATQSGAGKSQKESNQKNVRDNYFKLAGSDLQEDNEHPIPQSKTAMKNKPQPPSLYSQNEKSGGTLHQKRSSTNLKNRSRERSSEMKQKKSTVDHNKYRSSMVEANIYAQGENPKVNLMIQHQVTQSQSVTKGNGNEMLIIERKQTSEPQVKPMQATQKVNKAMAVPSLNLETMNANSIDMAGDQFLKTMNIQNPQQSSLNKFVKVQYQNINQQSIKNLNLKAMQKPIGDLASQNNNKFLRQMKYQQVQQQLKTQSLTQPQTVPDTDRNSLGQIQEVKQHANGVSQDQSHKSYLHSSTSQLQNFSVSQIPGEEKHLFKNMISKIENQSLFAGGDQFVIPAQSHRNPARNAQQKLSISAGKNVIGGKNKNDFMKSTANLKKDFSEIQSNNMIGENDTQIEGQNPKHGQTSKLSIEQDIKFLKMSLNIDKKKQQSVEKQTKNYMNTVSQNNRAQKAANGSKQRDSLGGQNVNTMSDVGAGSQVSNSMRKSRVSSLEMKEKKLKGNNQRLLMKNKSPQKTPSLSIQTKHVKPKMELNSGSISTKSNKVVYRKIKQGERTDTETSEQKDKNSQQSKQQNYKKLILENNAKILQYQQKSQTQTPKQGTQLGFMTNKQNVLLDAGGVKTKNSGNTKQQFINQLTANQFQTTQTIQSSQGGIPSKIGKLVTSEKLESNFSSMPQMVHKDSQSSGKSAQYRQLQNKQQSAIQDKTPNMQYFKTNEYDINTLDVYGRSEEEGYIGNDGSGLGHISSGEQQIGQMTREKLNTAQFNSSVANKSNSLFSGSGYPTNQQKSSGSGILGHASIGGLGTTGSNTTANTNSYIGGNHTNNKSGMQNSLNQRSLLNNLVDTAQDSSNQKQQRKKLSSGNQRLAKKSSMKVSQDNLEF